MSTKDASRGKGTNEIAGHRRGMTRRAACLLGVLLAFALTLVAPFSARAVGDINGGADATTTSVTIVHTTDTHGYYKASSSAVGFSALAALVDELSPELLLDAGDTFHGQSFATVTQGASTLELMNLVGYDAMTIGNHDWSYGASRLAELAADSGTDGVQVLAGNVADADGNPLLGGYMAKTVTTRDGTTLKLGVIGVMDEALATSFVARNLEGCTVSSSVEVANELAAAARADGCDLVVVLRHGSDPAGFAAQLVGVDAVVAGHEHQFIDTQVTAADGRQVPVVEAGCYFRGVGELTLSLEQVDGAWQVAGYTEEVVEPAQTADLSRADVDAAVEQLEAENSQILDEAIGTSEGDYLYSWEGIRSQDQAIGHVITAAYLSQTGADVALENAGGVRGGIAPGEVTAGTMLAISPYGNTLDTYQMTGADLLSMLERSLVLRDECNQAWTAQKAAEAAGMSYDEYAALYPFPDSSGSVLVVGGMTLEIDGSQPEGQRIVSATIGGKAVDPAATYTVAMNSYIPQLEGLYPELANKRHASEWGTCEQALRAFVGQSDWESQVYELSGTETLVDGHDAGEGEGEKPGTGEDENEKPGDATPSDTDSANANKGNDAAPIPQAGDELAPVGAVAAGGAALLVAARALRRRAA